MKVKFVLSLLIGVLIIVAGCAKCPTAEKKVELAPGVKLPHGFAVMKGLSDADYNEQGWPKYIVCLRDGSIMTLVDAQEYVMGSFGGPVNETPQHPVKVGMYYIDLYEVDNVQFDHFARESAFVWKDHPYLADELLSSETPRCWLKRNWKPSHAECLESHPSHTGSYVQMDIDYFKEYWKPGVNDTHPARAVSYWEAWYYCRWVGKDLPTEAEWELAAKGPDDRLYPWGNIEPDSQHLLCNYGGPRPSEDGYEYTAPVSAFAAGRSPYGCYNMAGNVWEWCKDNYDASIYSSTDFNPTDSEIAREMTNPKGASLGQARVLRGGAFTSDISNCRTTTRTKALPNTHSLNVGFRGVLRIR